MVEVKELYAQTYKKTLADDIKELFKDEDVRNVLLALIKGMSSPLVINLKVPSVPIPIDRAI